MYCGVLKHQENNQMMMITTAYIQLMLICRYVNLSQELHRVDLTVLSQDERLAFFLNLYNAMVIHAAIRVGLPEGIIDRRSFDSDFQYVVGGRPYSLTTIVNGILRNNRRAPYSLVKPFSNGDPRLEVSSKGLDSLDFLLLKKHIYLKKNKK